MEAADGNEAGSNRQDRINCLANYWGRAQQHQSQGTRVLGRSRHELSDPSKQPLRQKLSERCLECAREQKTRNLTWQQNKVLIAEVTDVRLAPDVLMFVVAPKPTEDALVTQRQLQQAFFCCPEQAEYRKFGSIAIAPMTGEDEAPTNAWGLAQAAAEALKEFTLKHKKSTLTSVDFVKGYLTVADIFATVLNRMTTPTDVEPTTGDVRHNADQGPTETTDTNKQTELQEIDCVLKR